MLDGHIHLHYGVFHPDERIRRDSEELFKMLGNFGVERVAGVFLPDNKDVVNEFDRVYPGVYVRSFEVEEIRNENFEFLKVHEGFLPFTDEVLVEVLETGTKNGFEKFQFHTNPGQEHLLKTFTEYVDREDVKIYLVHGARELLLNEEIISYEGNIFFGTSTSRAMILPDDKEKLLKNYETLPDMIVFESDFGLSNLNWNGDYWYRIVLDDIGSLGFDGKIFKKNLKKFLR